MGHVLKTAWVLGRIHELFPDPASVQIAESLAQNVWQRGYDHQLGGPYKDYDRLTGVMMMYVATTWSPRPKYRNAWPTGRAASPRSNVKSATGVSPS